MAVLLMTAQLPSQLMRGLGVVQSGDARLRRPTRPLNLPAEAATAHRLVARLSASADDIARVHVFGKGMGLAAPQLGIDRAAAVVRPAGGETIALLNPVVAGAADEVDEQYEGCLSFFDVRGLVPRPLWLDVQHQTVTGQRTVTRFERALARLVAHEIDHLQGLLYTDRMRPGLTPIGVDQYRGTGSAWRY
jgi:peptide deformylase